MNCESPLIAILILASLDSYAQEITTNSKTFPGSSWEKLEHPLDFGWDSLKLSGLTKFIIDSTSATGVMVIYRGRILLEYGDTKEASPVASIRKSILAMMYGPFVTNKHIDLSTSLARLNFDDRRGLSETEKQATIAHLMTARSGIYHVASDSSANTIKAPPRGLYHPGEKFFYNNWDFNALGTIFEQLTHKDIYDAFDSMLAKPLQLQDWRRTEQVREGNRMLSKHLSYPIILSTRDMARIAYLMLRNGEWKGRQIIEKSWVEKISFLVTPASQTTTGRTNPPPELGFGYMWWVWDKPYNSGAFENAFTSWGGFGQYLTVLPKLDIVVAFKTKQIYQRQTSMRTYLRLMTLLVGARTIQD